MTDNGKVFTGRFGPGTGEVLFDRICRENGIKHILTRPRSPTTTGKVELWHKTLRREFLDGKVFASIADAQAELDAWVEYYNHVRPHQSLGMANAVGPVPAREERTGELTAGRAGVGPVSGDSAVGDTMRVPARNCQLRERALQGRSVACRSERAVVFERRTRARTRDRAERPTASVVTVTRKVDSSGNVSFAGANYRVGNAYRRRRCECESPSSAITSS